MAEPLPTPADLQDGFTVGTLPPGPVADRLIEAAGHVPDRPDQVLALALEAQALADGDPLAEAFAQAYEGFARYLLSEHEAALGLLTRALAAMEPLGDLAGRSLMLGVLASVHVSLGHYDEALDIALGNLRVARALGDIGQEAWTRAMMGNAYIELDQPDRALEHGEAALRLFADLDNAVGQARAHTALGGALRSLARYAEARAHFEAALRLSREHASTLTEARALHDLGLLAHLRGDDDQALALHREALRIRTEVGNRQAQATSLIAIGQTLAEMGRPDDARPALHEALGIAQDVGAEPREAEAHAALADAYEAAGDAAAALRHLRAFHDLREALLSAQARSRIQTVEIRAQAERAQQEAEMARIRTEELGAANAELSETLRELRAAQTRLVQSEKLASLGRLSAGLAHEIQNPLNFVANFAELNTELATDLLATLEAALDGGDFDPAQARDDLEAIAANSARVRDHARRADAIVRGLMGHVRDVGGERRPTDLHELIEQAVSTVLGPSVVRVERGYGELAPVELAPASLQRVFVNLFENARWAVEHRAEAEKNGFVPTVRIETAPIEAGVEVRVVDNGIGIPLAHCTRVFEPFFTTKPAGSGTGLGLSLAYDIVTEGHGGTLAAYSREGEGATFVLTLPA
ncbi:tetratricopeptide repeat protein [Rubrivirga sp. IMCC45206]|uniref:tetratricopeptide repeat protein n=1 Tax=Rubrivirga sp. IMCC45206 TaxID=3391614 RepID=UPI003990391B